VSFNKPPLKDDGEPKAKPRERIVLNGTTFIAETRTNAPNAAYLNCSVDHLLDADDFVEVEVQHNAGNNLDLTSGSATDEQLWFSVHLIGVA
jgi:hypothetical protein